MIRCPHCDAKLDPHADLIGRRTKCPECEKPFVYDERPPAKWLRAGAMIALAFSITGIFVSRDNMLQGLIALVAVILCLIFFLLDTRLPKRPA